MRDWLQRWRARRQRSQAASSALVVCAGVFLTQFPAAAPGSISGIVIDQASGAAIAGATVSLIGSSGLALQSTATDGHGAFEVKGVEPGSYRLRVARSGYAEGYCGQRFPDGPKAEVAVTDAADVRGVRIVLWPYCTLTGVVLDEQGDAAVQADARLFRRWAGGSNSALALAGSTQTDDRGEYRFPFLLPGDYFVEVGAPAPAVPRNPAQNDPGTLRELQFEAGHSLGPLLAPDGTVLVYPPTFFPDSIGLDSAQALTLSGGNERRADFRLVPVPAVSVSGILRGEDGAPISMGAVTLSQVLPEEVGLSHRLEVGSAVSDSAGRFVFPLVPQGRYMMTAHSTHLRPVAPRSDQAPPPQWVLDQASFEIAALNAELMARTPHDDERRTAAPPDELDLWAEAEVTVGVRPISMDLTTRAMARVSGSVRFDGARPSPSSEQVHALSVSLRAVSGSGPGFLLPSAVAGDGTFMSSDVPPGSYLVSVTGVIPGWTVESISIGGDGAVGLDVPVSLTSGVRSGALISFSDKAGGILRGTVRDSAHSPREGQLVVAFPADRATWPYLPLLGPSRVEELETGNDGSFRFVGLLPGNYLVAAVDDGAPGEWERPEALAVLSRSGTPTVVRSGETTEVEVRR